jgi:polysaccharide biosynthesis protein PslH
MKSLLRRALRSVGKGELRVAAAFGHDAETCHRAVLHLRAGIPDVPIWLFSTAQPFAETAALCERVSVRRSTAALLIHAEGALWRRWVVIAVGAWTGERRRWLLKIAPLLVPPFRALFVNSEGDFLPGSPRAAWKHCRWRLYNFTDQTSGRLMTAAARMRGVIRRTRDRLQGVMRRLRGVMRRMRDRLKDGAERIYDSVAAGSLAALATLLDRCHRPHRKVFHRVRRKQQPPLRHSTGKANGQIDVYRQTGKAWNGARFESFLRSSDAQWVLWQQDGLGEFQNAPLLWSDHRTFAVARQVDFRGWKEGVIHTAPFRALQPGEASGVVAPISNAILADREKLLALGVPRCRFSITAWMLLYWRAAAAGWRSYSLGHSAALKEQPDFPVEETAFVCGSLWNRKLRSLAPWHPELSRGNIAFLPTPPGAPRGRLKVLVVSPFLPYPLSHGGAVRIYNLCKALANTVDFALVSVREKHDAVDYDKLREVFREVYVVDLDDAMGADTSLPDRVRHLESPSLRALIADVCRRWQPDLAQFEYTQTAALRTSAGELPAILVEHDLTFQLYRQMAEVEDTKSRWQEYGRWLAFEQRWLSAFDGVWTMSEENRIEAIEEGSAVDRTFAVPNGVDLRRFRPDGGPEPLEILYVGSFRHHPNVVAFENLRDKIMPLVWEQFPKAHLRVVAGPRHESYCRTARLDPRIEIHGFVEDLVPLYRRAAVVVAPLVISAGTNVKVLEALACGKAIVSTPVGCAGLGLSDGRDALIREDSADFAAAVCDLLASPERRMAAGHEARRTAERCFSWDEIALRAYESYQSVLSQSVAPLDSSRRPRKRA